MMIMQSLFDVLALMSLVVICFLEDIRTVFKL